jgi:hypothetical protein
MYNTAKAQQQEEPVVTGQYNLPLAEILQQLEKNTGYQFYYNKLQLDTNRLQISYNHIPLTKAMEMLLASQNLAFTIYQKKVFITKGILLQTKLPDWFFTGNKNAPIDTARQLMVQATAGEPKKIYTIGNAQTSNTASRFTITGYVRDAKNGEPVGGASLQIENSSINVVTDQFGFFTLRVPKGKLLVSVQSIGMEDLQMDWLVQGDGALNIHLQTRISTLKNVTVSAQKTSNLRSTQLGVQKLDIKTIKQVPVVFGEADILRVLTTTPGVKTVGEASTGLNVRGGAADQNLILLNDANIFNPSHFFGMFSAFNPEVVKEVDLYKGSVPAKYGGRLSSVINITSREGNKKKLAGSAGIGLITSRLQLEGPIVKDKSSFIIAGRSTYANWLLNLLPAEYKNSRASFYDINAIVNHEFNKKNTVYLTAYTSRDQFNLNSDTFFNYKNQNISIKWKHNFNPKLYTFLTIGHDGYEYNISSEKNPINAYKMSFDIAQSYMRYHFNYTVNAKHTVEFGLNATYYKLNPGSYKPVGERSLVAPVVMSAEQAIESALYLSDNFKITPKLTLDAGLRYSLYAYLGPSTVNNYSPNIPKREDNVLSTSNYGNLQIINTNQGPEVRIGLRQMLSPTLSVKAGYNSLRQYIHMLSNTAAMAPTDIWKLSDPNIKPQFGDQFSIGLYKTLAANSVEISVEWYYKRIKNYLDFKSGAKLVLNPHVETEVMSTRGKAYGVEFQIKKTAGKLNGWISYTYSRILLNANNAATGEIINKGNYYPANYDKPHDVTLIGNYRFSHRFSLSLNSTYSTGRPITLPIGRFNYADGMRTLYGERNGHRIPDYFRTDFSINIEGNHKVKQKIHDSWTIGVYNITGRRNPYSVYYVSQNGVINGYKLSIFGNIIPFVNFNIKF